jgi:hypothetical protein
MVFIFEEKYSMVESEWYIFLRRKAHEYTGYLPRLAKNEPCKVKCMAVLKKKSMSL